MSQTLKQIQNSRRPNGRLRDDKAPSLGSRGGTTNNAPRTNTPLLKGRLRSSFPKDSGMR